MSKCKICKTKLVGRKDKVFCSIKCKNLYHVSLRAVTTKEAHNLDRHLHRNRSILLELMGKTQTQKKLSRLLLEEKKFKFKYVTHYYINSKSKIMNYVYDFGWMDFSDDEVLVVRKKNIN